MAGDCIARVTGWWVSWEEFWQTIVDRVPFSTRNSVGKRSPEFTRSGPAINLSQVTRYNLTWHEDLLFLPHFLRLYCKDQERKLDQSDVKGKQDFTFNGLNRQGKHFMRLSGYESATVEELFFQFLSVPPRTKMMDNLANMSDEVGDKNY